MDILSDKIAYDILKNVIWHKLKNFIWRKDYDITIDNMYTYIDTISTTRIETIGIDISFKNKQAEFEACATKGTFLFLYADDSIYKQHSCCAPLCRAFDVSGTKGSWEKILRKIMQQSENGVNFYVANCKIINASTILEELLIDFKLKQPLFETLSI